MSLQRQKETFRLAEGEYKIYKQQMLDWAKQFSIFIFLDNNEYESKYSSYECLLAVKPTNIIAGNEEDLLQQLHHWHTQHQDWLFGHICYDYKNLIEPKLSSRHEQRFAFPLLHFFCPQIVCYINKEKTALIIESINEEPRSVFDAISNMEIAAQKTLPAISFKQRINEQQYLSTIRRLQRHIADGDCYEINFCNEGYCEDAAIDPLQVFRKLNQISPAPFAAFYRMDTQYMMCASPERYIRKADRIVLSQPIKGTAKRGTNTEQDNAARDELRKSIKDIAENVMIVDLVRNDIARSCKTGSVSVDELFGIYTFPQVHQMISTISGTLRDDGSFADVIRYSFPMGSMTGAPKIKVMDLIEQYEHVARELFSGTVGYITPNADFDFNVIIRSLFYNGITKYLSYKTGGAITYDSDPQKEWEEMRLKAWALEKVFL